MKVLFCGSKSIAADCFQILLEREARGQCEVAGIMTRPVKDIRSGQIFEVIHPDPGVPVWSGYAEVDEALSWDVLISVQHNEVLPKAFLDRVGNYAVNLHMAPLPEYRGCNQFSFAIYDGSPLFGTTLHFMDAGVDSGPIVAERRFSTDGIRDVRSLYDRTEVESVHLFAEHVDDLISGQATAMDPVKYADRDSRLILRKDIKSISEIDDSHSTEEMFRRIRACAISSRVGPGLTVDGVHYTIRRVDD
jgi:methionyl-tRNA formyltransferase